MESSGIGDGSGTEHSEPNESEQVLGGDESVPLVPLSVPSASNHSTPHSANGGDNDGHTKNQGGPASSAAGTAAAAAPCAELGAVRQCDAQPAPDTDHRVVSDAEGYELEVVPGGESIGGGGCRLAVDGDIV